MTQSIAQKIVPHLWYTNEAVEAAKFYASLFPNSHIERIISLPADSPSGPTGSVEIVEFTLCGQVFTAFSAGPHHPFNDAISLMVNCDTQQEIDHYWNTIRDTGGKEQACGWIIDKFGLRWQITPRVLGKMMADPDTHKAQRVAEVMLRQIKLDISQLEAAYRD
jgi:predicted 3-demethylubiquinone-9 3-methyltransferase (glyoxalase superfamily)